MEAAEAASKEAEKKEKASSEELVNCTSLIKRFEGELPDHQEALPGAAGLLSDFDE